MATASPIRAPPRLMSLSLVSHGAKPRPRRILVYGPEGVGKSSFAASAPSPIFLGAEDGTASLDVARFPKATVKIANVKKAGERAYTADATVSIHGVEKTWALSFEVTASTADSVQVKFTQPFSRVDFGVGKPEEDSAKPEVELHGLLTIKQT